MDQSQHLAIGRRPSDGQYHGRYRLDSTDPTGSNRDDITHPKRSLALKARGPATSVVAAATGHTPVGNF
jgi:hypothetical protein